MILVLLLIMFISELWLLLAIGAEIGSFLTMLWVILSALLGISMIRAARAQMFQGDDDPDAPSRTMMDTMLLFLGGAFLVVPGLITDVVGIVYLLNPTRRLMLRMAARYPHFLAAGGAKLGVALRARALAQFLFHLQLYRQAVAVPAGHERRIATVQQAAFNDNVLENLVDRVADVNVAVRVRRAIVQHKALAAAPRRANLLVQVDVLPPREHPRLARGQPYLLYTSPSPRDATLSRMPSSA